MQKNSQHFHQEKYGSKYSTYNNSKNPEYQNISGTFEQERKGTYNISETTPCIEAA